MPTISIPVVTGGVAAQDFPDDMPNEAVSLAVVAAINAVAATNRKGTLRHGVGLAKRAMAEAVLAWQTGGDAWVSWLALAAQKRERVRDIPVDAAALQQALGPMLRPGPDDDVKARTWLMLVAGHPLGQHSDTCAACRLASLGEWRRVARILDRPARTLMNLAEAAAAAGAVTDSSYVAKMTARTLREDMF